jgi:hypothetical protein
MKSRWKSAKTEKDAIIAAAVFTVLVHLLVFLVTPRTVTLPEPHRYQPNTTFDLVLDPIEDELDQDMRYVRATPDVPEEAPEETINISDRDQVAAQPDQPDELDFENTPMVDGDMEESNRLVQGNPYEQPTPPAPPESGAESEQSPMVEQQPAPRQQPVVVAPDFRENEERELDEDGIAEVEERSIAEERPLEEPEDSREMAMDETSPEDGMGDAQTFTPPQQAEEPSQQPRPRMRVERDTSYGPIRSNRQGAVRIGRLAFDAQYSEFGEYWRRVAEIIERRWRSLIYNSRSITFNGNRVVVHFEINRDGRITNVRVTDSAAGRLAESMSVDAIVGEAPFFPWTPDMILRMGDAAECSIHFYY